MSNLIKNWKKETSHKARLEDWRTVNVANYAFSCNGGIEHDAQQMQDLGTSNALIQANNTCPCYACFDALAVPVIGVG